jgi:hypothetical protein
MNDLDYENMMIRHYAVLNEREHERELVHTYERALRDITQADLADANWLRHLAKRALEEGLRI